MAELLKIRLYPDPVLRKPCEAVSSFDESLKALSENMLHTMYHEGGVGLAAPQVGHSLRLIVLDITEDKSAPMVLVNPEIVHKSEEASSYQEGCLSFPQIFSNLKSHNSVSVKFQNIAGEPQSIDVSGLLAIAIQHEIDHLNGTLMIDRMGAKERAKIKTSMMRKR